LAAVSLPAMISQYFMESLPFSSPDGFPTRHNLSVWFSGLNGPQAHGQYHKTLSNNQARVPVRINYGGIMNHEVRELSMLLQVEVWEVNDLRCLQAAEGYIELEMYDEADAEIAKVNPTCRIFRLFVCAELISLQPLPAPDH
jgi:hypothetical protein